ncbi:4Fe-4S cluster-binding domain-containing protein [Georgenia thermotolerans]|uniref:4Fe-4S cluster-binding domain-containing protein n=1 Tax=Georgenia thermotolerans TaxID=527326 RepID=A0A7J5UUB2_9MICO|nr:4Fe-4S cluster-binding domain-containing protein [Georgenia thermotolerans]
MPAATPAPVSPGAASTTPLAPAAPPAAATPPPASPAGRLRWARFLPATVAEGPGRRAALWVQGCRIHCPGCFNPELWAARGGRVDDPAALAARLLAQAQDGGVEGLTLLGGEPFDQAAALAVVARAFREAGLTVMTFTGYRHPSLTAWADDGREDVAALLAATDLLVDGPYLRDHPDRRRPWLGSTNQGLRALTPAYAAEVARLEREGGADRVELRLTRDGGIEVNGWAEVAALEELLDGLDGARLARLRRPTGPHLTRTTEGAPR